MNLCHTVMSAPRGRFARASERERATFLISFQSNDPSERSSISVSTATASQRFLRPDGFPFFLTCTISYTHTRARARQLTGKIMVNRKERRLTARRRRVSHLHATSDFSRLKNATGRRSEREPRESRDQYCVAGVRYVRT